MSPLKSKLISNAKFQTAASSEPKAKVSPECALEGVVDEYPPVWKSAFTLGQNVRFTRTPEVEIIRRRVEIDPEFAERVLKEKQTSRVHVMDTPITKVTIDASAISDNDAKFVGCEEQRIASQNIATQENKLSLPNTELSDRDNGFQGVDHNSNLSVLPISDFAFFELNGLDGDGVFQTNFFSTTTNNLPKQEIEGLKTQQFLGKSITDLFRVLECRFPDVNTSSNEGQNQTSDAEANGACPAENTKQKDETSPVGFDEGIAAHDLSSGTEIIDTVEPNFESEKPKADISSLITTAQNIAEDELTTSMSHNNQSIIEDIDPILPTFPIAAPTFPDDATQKEKTSSTSEIEAEHDSNSHNGACGDSIYNSGDSTLTALNNEPTKVLPQIIRPMPAAPEAALSEAVAQSNHLADVDNFSVKDMITAKKPVASETVTQSLASSSEPQRKPVAVSPRYVTELHAPMPVMRKITRTGAYEFPSIDLLQQPALHSDVIVSQETLERSAGLLESVLEDFGVKGEIIHVRPGPVVTLYEFEPAAGVKSSRVIGLSDDIARSMSAVSARVAVIPGRNVIGIELPNQLRETVYLRELIETKAFRDSNFKLALALGKNIGGEPVIAELAKMPHLLVAGTTGSGKSVAINTMILSLLYRMTPEQCRLIMVDPKMLELSIYDGIPHLLTPVVTDPKKAVTALKWAVREMEDRYRKMAKLGVRNIDGFNSRISLALERGEVIQCNVQAGFDKETGELLYQQEEMELVKLPYIVVIVDEMADLMMVAGKEIESAIQRLAQMARAAGIHLIMATQRPSVDVITGTIKANFPTRISFQVTSKIDSRTILGEQGAETLLGQGDMLHMAGGGRIVRVHGPFVSDEEVEKVVAHLKTQGTPDYLANVTDNTDEDDMIDEADSVAEILAAGAGTEDSEELYLQAVKVVMRDKKCSTSYIQRRLGIGYNKAASLVERMEEEGIVGAANHVGKREILVSHRVE